MRIYLTKVIGVLSLSFSVSALWGQTVSADATPQSTSAAHSAKELVTSKCVQCHSDAIWRDQRQDARAWEATLYRMMGRGSVWTGEEIKTMAAFLALEYGPQSPKSAPVNR